MNEQRFVNLTPHQITVVNEGQVLLSLPPTEELARVKTTDIVIKEFNSIPMYQVLFGIVENGPPAAYDPNVLYIVSRITAEALQRKDCVVPHGLARDEAGQIIGCKGFAFV